MNYTFEFKRTQYWRLDVEADSLEEAKSLAADKENEDWECVESTLEKVTWVNPEDEDSDYEEIPSDEWHPDWR